MAFFVIGLSFLLGSCSQATLQPTPTLMPQGVLTPYLTLTPTIARPTPTYVLTIPVTPSPTPTPFLYTITNDDTMLGLAFRFGVSLEDLKAANPTVNPNAMSVGSQLVIPINPTAPQEIPTATAVPLKTGQPVCYPSGDGGAWCVVGMHNDTVSSLENLSVWIGLYNDHGENVTNQVAYAPLNILLPGNTMPMMAYFAGPLPNPLAVRGELLSASVVAPDDPRYLAVEVKTGQVSISPAGTQAVVAGEVLLAEAASAPSQVWVLAVAYNSAGNIVGMRKWKSAGDTQFDITVYSLAGKIDHVDLLVEARP